MSPFLNPALLYLGLPLLAVPILIHLINLMRHRRVQWAAMEFLLESQKKNSTWILIKQLLLLLLRILAVAAIVLIVAQPLLHNQLGRLLGGTKTHHIVLLDDSFSMSDRWADTSAFDRAKQFLNNLGQQAARRAEPQTFTLMRFSRAGKLARGRPPDFLKEVVNNDFVVKLQARLATLEASQSAAGPSGALEAIDQLLGSAEDENRVVYLVSDFRTREWEEAAALNKALTRLNEAGAQLRLIPCVDAARNNLAVTSLRALPGTKAAGVYMLMEVAVTNYGGDTARDVAIKLEEDGQSRAGEQVDVILPGRTEAKQFQVRFETAGEHRVVARLENDHVQVDNTRFAVLNVPLAVPVLIVDGDADARDGYFLNTALNPGAVTGISPQVELPRFLNNHPLDEFQAIYLANVDRLDPPAIEALEKFVQAGGGVAFFMGELCDARFYTEQLHRAGEGLFPLPLVGPTELLVNRLEKAADLEVSEHPVFKIFAGERNTFLGDVAVQRYFAAPDGWKPAEDSLTQVVARLRNGAPLAVERQFGEGRVLAFLTTAGTTWNNWGQNPSFVVTMHEVQAWLASGGPPEPAKTVDTPVLVELDPAKYQPQVRFIAPGEGVGGGVTVDGVVKTNRLEADFAETETSGVYQVELTTSDGEKETRALAYNVAPDEGNLKMLAGEELATRLKGVNYVLQPADQFQYDGAGQSGFNVSEGLLYLMIFLLLGEQVLAYSASYHPPVHGGAK